MWSITVNSCRFILESIKPESLLDCSLFINGMKSGRLIETIIFVLSLLIVPQVCINVPVQYIQ